MALRAAGYLPCPRLWLTKEQMDLVTYMAKQNEADVARIRARANQTLTKEEEMERAWKMAGRANT